MSKKIHSQDSNFEFTIVFDKEKETNIQKIKRWIKKQKPPFNTILMHLFSYVEVWYWEGKLIETMSNIDSQVEDIHKKWDEEHGTAKPNFVETGVFGEEGWSISLSTTDTDRRSEESESSLGITSDEERLHKTFPDPWEGDWNDGVYTWNLINKNE
jgi:hypothetical protein